MGKNSLTEKPVYTLALDVLERYHEGASGHIGPIYSVFTKSLKGRTSLLLQLEYPRGSHELVTKPLDRSCAHIHRSAPLCFQALMNFGTKTRMIQVRNLSD